MQERVKRRLKYISISVILLLALLTTIIGVPSVRQDIATGKYIIIIGTEVQAASADYTCDGVDDDEQYQDALDALPTNGGKLVVLAGNYNFSATVSRAIDNVTIMGIGKATYFAHDDTTAIFSAGSQDAWVFMDFATDAGGINVTTATNFTIRNILVGTAYLQDVTAYGSYLGAPGTPDYVVGVNTATDDVPGSAGYWVKSGSTGRVVRSTASPADDDIQWAIDALGVNGGKVHLSAGVFNIDAPVQMNKSGIWIEGESQGWASSNGERGTVTTTISTTGATDAFWLGGAAYNFRGLKLSNLNITGTGYANGHYAIYNPDHATTKLDTLIVEDCSINGFQKAIYIRGDTCYFSHNQILWVTDGIDCSLGGDLNSANQVMCGDIFGIGFKNLSRVENCGVVNADDMGGIWTHATVGILNCEIVNGNHIWCVQAGNVIDVGIKDCKEVNNNYINTVTMGIQAYVDTWTRVISGNNIENTSSVGIHIYNGKNIAVTGNSVRGSTGDHGIGLYSATDIICAGNHCYDNYKYGIDVDGGSINIAVLNNLLEGNGMGATRDSGINTSVLIQGNKGYIAPGEIRTYSGTITTLTQNAYNSLDNPFGQAVRVLRLDIYVSTNATVTSPNIDCGIGASATTDYTTLFDDLPGETIGFYTSTIATPGTQTVPLLWSSGSGNRYLNMSIKDAAATGMVAKYTVTVMGN